MNYSYFQRQGEQGALKLQLKETSLKTEAVALTKKRTNLLFPSFIFQTIYLKHFKHFNINSAAESLSFPSTSNKKHEKAAKQFTKQFLFLLGKNIS